MNSSAGASRRSVAQEIGAELGRVQAHERMAAGREQFGQLAGEPRVVLGRDEAALLVARRVEHDEVRRRAAPDLSPGVEDVVRWNAARSCTPLSLVVAPAGGGGPRAMS